MTFAFAARSVALAAGLAALAGCSTKPPGCGDERTQALVMSVFRDSLTSTAAQLGLQRDFVDKVLASAPVALTMVRASKTEESISKLTCEATLGARLPGRLAEGLASPAAVLMPGIGAFRGGVNLDGNSVQADVEFTSQVTETKEHLVTLQGHRDLAGMLAVLGAHGLFDPPAAAVEPVTASPSPIVSGFPAASSTAVGTAEPSSDANAPPMSGSSPSR